MLPGASVNRPNLDFRGYAGYYSGERLVASVVRVGQAVQVLPSGVTSTISCIVTFDGDLPEAWAGEVVTLVLADEVDISRGDLLVDASETLPAVQNAQVDVVWPLAPGGVTRQDREALHKHHGAVLWFTGLSGSGKSTLAGALEQALHQRGVNTYLLDGDNVCATACAAIWASAMMTDARISALSSPECVAGKRGTFAGVAFTSQRQVLMPNVTEIKHKTRSPF